MDESLAACHLFSFGPALIVDGKGIVDHVSLARPGRIPWSEISGFRTARVTGNRVLVIRAREHRAKTHRR